MDLTMVLTWLIANKLLPFQATADFVPPAGIEPARHTAIDFESIAATITPRGFDWAFRASQPYLALYT